MLKLLKNFWNYVQSKNIAIYNEFSLQHELGIYLREKKPGYRVEFERNIKYFGINKSCGKLKSEIDIVIYNANEKYAFELKYPRHGQHTKRTYQFLTDISFMEYVKEKGEFRNTYVMTVIDNDANGQRYRIGNKRGANGRYQYFRSLKGNKAYSPIVPGKYYYSSNSSEYVEINGNYDNITWETTGINEPMFYYILKI